jgi:hypothetical protein
MSLEDVKTPTPEQKAQVIEKLRSLQQQANVYWPMHNENPERAYKFIRDLHDLLHIADELGIIDQAIDDLEDGHDD